MRKYFSADPFMRHTYGVQRIPAHASMGDTMFSIVFEPEGKLSARKCLPLEVNMVRVPVLRVIWFAFSCKRKMVL